MFPSYYSFFCGQEMSVCRLAELRGANPCAAGDIGQHLATSIRTKVSQMIFGMMSDIFTRKKDAFTSIAAIKRGVK
jgi:hypothetical protein